MKMKMCCARMLDTIAGSSDSLCHLLWIHLRLLSMETDVNASTLCQVRNHCSVFIFFSVLGLIVQHASSTGEKRGD